MRTKTLISAVVILSLAALFAACGGGGGGGGGSTSTYTVGGTLAGLGTGKAVTLQNNGGDALAITEDGLFTFATALADGSPYAVTVKTQPYGQTCSVANGTGTISGANITNVAVSCYNSGSLDPDFGTNGVVTSNPSLNGAVASAVAIDSTYMYVVGVDLSLGNYDAQWRIEKRKLSSGELVTGFGTNGVVTSNPSSGGDSATAIAIDSTYMYVAGHDASPGNYDGQWRIEKRRLSNGELVTDFGTDGVVTSNPSLYGEGASAIAIDSTYMYVVGSDESAGQWRIEKRKLTNGELVTGFGTNGVVTSKPSFFGAEANAIAIDSTYMYVVGHENNKAQWRIEKRKLSSGDLVTGFGADGVVTSNPSSLPGDETANAIAIDSAYMYVVGIDYSAADFKWRIEKRKLSSGDLVTGFGTDGVVTSNPSSGSEMANTIAIDTTYMYVAGNDVSPGNYNYQWRIEKRELTSGELVTGFGTNGVVTSNPSSSGEQPYAITIDSIYMYVAGYDYSPGNSQWRIEKRVK